MTDLAIRIADKKRTNDEMQASERFAIAILDSLSTHISILNEDGIIVAVNKAWRTFAIANGGNPSCVSRGADYIGTCRKSRGDDSEYAHRMADGLEDVIEGRRAEFVMEYPCHSFSEHRWFIAHVTRFCHEGKTMAVVSHEDTTRRRLAEDAVAERTRQLELAYDRTIEGWSYAMDLRDEETEGHSRRVTELTVLLAEALGLSPYEIDHVRRGALLHDIGKIGIPDSILLKPGPLTDSEWTIMRQHPVYAHEMLRQIEYLAPSMDIPWCHHEKWDGTGYPRGLKGEEIPLSARLFCVVDVWDALRSDRPYRKGWPDNKVYAHIRSLVGVHFEPALVGLFFEVLGVSDAEDFAEDFYLPKAA